MYFCNFGLPGIAPKFNPLKRASMYFCKFVTSKVYATTIAAKFVPLSFGN